MRGRLACIALCALACRAGQGGSSVRDIMALVRFAIHEQEPEKHLVRELHKARLNERLEDRVIEELESEGAPPKAQAELERLRDASKSLSLPAQPVEFDSPPQPSSDEQAAIIEDARQNALNYSRTLPNFICTEMIHRYEDRTGTESWIPRDVLTVKLSYFEQAEDYKLTAINNRPTRKEYMSIEGASSSGEFGTLLRHIFEPESRVDFTWDHWTVLRKRPAHVYRFQVPPARSHYVLEFETNSGHARAAAGTHGFVYVDRDTHIIVRLVREADSLPANFPIQRASSFVDYGFTDVGGRPALLPLRAGLIMQYSKLLTRNEVFFESYKKFTADAAISFGDPDEEKPPSKP